MWRIALIGGILLTAVTNLLTPLQARKLVHIGCGIILAHINVPDPLLKAIIIAVAVVSIIVFKTVPLRFGIKNDAGIIWYNLIVLLFVIFGLPIRVLLPVFIIDPVACIVGVSTRSKKWCGNKTVYGTLAAGIASYFSLYYVRMQHHRLLLSLILPITEGVMRQHDNIGISIVVLLYYCAAQHFGWPVDLSFTPLKTEV
ncbi:phosphatidate cytidylyltransferase [Babesia ovata]|uniref:Phosphatidate cytidylyltransferase n=1 Tax=Babesia ovata TaxID=189622 RepID=A0A2H6KHI8_9APIC|nr:phosphatidate cytidylyltransferase [Babesia ovata]GBE62467.1 phosphatidate cytidylyltransferase [Babesia ovata]